MKLQSFAEGRWHPAGADSVQLLNAVNGDLVAESSSVGLDFRAMLSYAREVGGPALTAMTFHQRALMLKQLATHLNNHKEEFYGLSSATGATKSDSMFDIDGGISTVFVYASKGRRELPNDTIYLDGDPEFLSREGGFVGQHVYLPLQGVAVHINAFNFPCWGMLEKLAPTLLAGLPAIIKPATSTSYLTELVFRRMVEAQVLPPGAVQLICGSTGDLFEHLNCQDVVAFTGSAATARALRQHPNVISQSVRFTAETDSLNCSILGADADPTTAEFAYYVREVVREMTTKAGQRCTAIRRALVPEQYLAAAIEHIQRGLSAVVVGDPTRDDVDMGPLASLGQRSEVRASVAELGGAAELVHGTVDEVDVVGADPERGAFLSPILLHCQKPNSHSAVHSVEAFGPVSTVIPYTTTADLIELAQHGGGSLVGSMFTNDDNFAREVVVGVAPYHGRLLIVNRDCAEQSTGHGSPLPHLVHGGPGRAGGGEELGGIRGVLHYMQRTALQGSPATIAAISNRWIKGAQQTRAAEHVFRKHFENLSLGDTLITQTRTVTLADIEHFAEFTGDCFYAHMDEEAAAANPFFDGRVAHGYFIISAAAGLFVDPPPGPVLANYGLEGLRFTQPVYPGDSLQVRLTCKHKTLREGEGYGEVRWDVEVTNQDEQTVATYDLLTLVATKPVS